MGPRLKATAKCVDHKHMAEVSDGNGERRLVFRTRAVLVAGLVDVVLGSVLLATGAGLSAWGGRRYGLPVGLTLSVVALIILLSGVGRVTSRFELSATQVTWRWTFSKSAVKLVDLEDADLVEKGSPGSGASWAGFLAGGLFGMAVWWLLDLAVAFLSSEPSLGPLELVLIKRHGGAVAVKPISAWSTRSSHSQAGDAVRAIKQAISASADRVSPPAPPLAALRYDEWDPIRDG